MKAKRKARIRQAETAEKRTAYHGKENMSPSNSAAAPGAPKAISAEELQRIQEEETREFLAYLEQDFAISKEETDYGRKNSRRTLICDLNLEDGMPTVEEAVSRMNLGFQEMRVSGVRLVRLIHGYGSTGRGG